MRVVVVDDQSSQRDGRVPWLSWVPGVEPVGMDFEQAMALREAWANIDVVVLDGHDRRSARRRHEAASRAGMSEPLPDHDRYIGARIAQSIRTYSPPETTRIVLISAHARDSDLRARRIAQSGVDYVFEHYEVDHDATTFVRAVLEPWALSPRDSPIDWKAQGYAREPDVAAAIRTVEESPAGSMLLSDGTHRTHPEHEWAVRSLRQRLQLLISPRLESTSGPRHPRAPRKSWYSEQLRQALGLDLPRDPEHPS
ncbi:MAG: hypothetical protein IPL37_00765 [Austwickia sp.]|jgi:CheY-like chemotaxis protein|nr:hypothetical protein [Austwickia sp.]